MQERKRLKSTLTYVLSIAANITIIITIVINIFIVTILIIMITVATIITIKSLSADVVVAIILFSLATSITHQTKSNRVRLSTATLACDINLYLFTLDVILS